MAESESSLDTGLDDTVGTAPDTVGTLRTWTADEDTELQVASGRRTLGPVSCDEAIVIEEDLCKGPEPTPC